MPLLEAVILVNARLVFPKNMTESITEINKINSDTNDLQCLASKVVHICLFVEDIPQFAVNIIKQEIFNNGGNVVYNDVVNDSLENTNVFITGNLVQINKLVMCLMMQQGILADIGSKIKLVTQTLEKKETNYYCCGRYKLEIGKKTYIMGILNITTDSFSGDGLLAEVPDTTLKTIAKTSIELSANDKESIIDVACRKAEQMVANGANIIDVGGESTRPGYVAVDEKEESDRILSVVEKLVKTVNVPISVDTSKSYVAENVLNAGAHIINDVNGLLKDPKIATLAASYGAGVIVMHNPDTPLHGDIFSCITKSLRKSVDVALKSGLKQDNIILDPGIGFGKTLQQNLEVMRRLDELRCLGYPVLLGTSRKSMIGNVLNLPVNERVEGTAATVTFGIAKGVDFIRVHDVKEMCRVVKMSDAMVRSL
ncbi:MAG: dihydropteroate synthase [Candidatus Bathyarchaeota archaeon]|nr:dihydropteroate synthase [Candidatus Termiticorpusculum sp.]